MLHVHNNNNYNNNNTVIQFNLNTRELCIRERRTGPLVIQLLILASFLTPRTFNTEDKTQSNSQTGRRP